MRYLSGLLSWLLLVLLVGGVVWLVQGVPAVVTVEGEGWRVQTSLAVVVVLEVLVLVVVAYGVLLLDALGRGWRRFEAWMDAWEWPWHRKLFVKKDAGGDKEG